MAKGRLISTNFWMDGKVEDDFTPEDKYAYLWCLTNPHTNLCGCYEVSIKPVSYTHLMRNHLSKAKCDDFIYRNIGPGGEYVYLHCHVDKEG